MLTGAVRKSEAIMSTTTDPSTESKESRLRTYLRQRAEDGEVYIKGKFIADDVGLSPKEIGALMVKLRDSAGDLEVEKWSYTSATTWRVSRA
jgi:CRP-like cAMP-binding protein